MLNLIKLLDIATPKQIKDTINILITHYNALEPENVLTKLAPVAISGSYNDLIDTPKDLVTTQDVADTVKENLPENMVIVNDKAIFTVGTTIKKGEVISFMLNNTAEHDTYIECFGSGGQYFYITNGYGGGQHGYGWNTINAPWDPIQGESIYMQPNKEYYFVYEGEDCVITSVNNGNGGVIFKPQRVVYVDSAKIQHTLIPSMIGAANAQEVEDKFAVTNQLIKGRTQAVAFNNYAAMYADLANKSVQYGENGEYIGQYPIGQSIFIGTLKVPDLWIAGYEPGAPTTEYITDEAFIAQLRNPEYGAVYVHGYVLQELETLKQDLTNYSYVDSLGRLVYNNGTEIKEVTSDMLKTPDGATLTSILNTKSTLYPDVPPQLDGNNVAMVQVVDTDQNTHERVVKYMPISVYNDTWSIVRRYTGGRVRGGDAVNEDDFINKRTFEKVILSTNKRIGDKTTDDKSEIANEVTINTEIVNAQDCVLSYQRTGKICIVNYAFTFKVETAAGGALIASGMPQAQRVQFFSVPAHLRADSTTGTPASCRLVNFAVDGNGTVRTYWGERIPAGAYVKGGFVYITK